MDEISLTKKAYTSVFINELGNIIKVNEYKDKIILLKPEISPSIFNEILTDIEEYLWEEQIQSLKEVDEKTKSRKKDKSEQTIRAFKIHKINGYFNSFERIEISLLKEYLGYNKISPNYSNTNSISTHELFLKYIKPLSFEQQKNLYINLLKRYDRKIIKLTHARQLFPFKVLEKSIETFKKRGIECVFNDILYLINNYKNYAQKIVKDVLLMKGGPNITIAALQKVLILISMKLRKHNIALFPFLWIKAWKYKKLDEVASKFMASNVKNQLKEIHYLKENITEATLSNEYDTIIGIFLCSNINSFNDFTPKLKYIIFECGRNFNKNASFETVLKTHLFRIQSYAITRGKIGKWEEYIPKILEDNAIYFEKELKLYPHLKSWIKLADSYLINHISKKFKTIHQYQRALNLWFKFLNNLKDPPLLPLQVRRKDHIRNMLETDEKKYFYDFVCSEEIKERTMNLRFSYLQFFFEYLSENYYENLKIPISPNDRFFIGNTNRKTVRKRIPSSLLNISKYLLLNDLNYIKKYKNAKKDMFNQNLKKMENIWWPGFKNIMIILLFLPIRNYQARWLDSGELDEYIIDFKKMEYIKNPSPYAIKNRKTCVLQIELDPLTEEKYYVIFIPVNKTGAPYTIPYAPKEVVKSIIEQIEFNRLWSKPISKPVRTVDKSSKEPHKTSKLYPEVAPLFRISIGRITDYQAVSAEKLYSFYIYLLEGIEKIVNEQGRKIQLVTRKENNKKQVLFDIHSLRVTGISELIEAGVPVEIVSEFVAGHANTVMTLYYNVIKHSKVKEILEKAQEDLHEDESITKLVDNIEDYEDLMIINETEGDIDTIYKFLKNDNSMPEISLDGICPGVDCSSVGREDGCCPKCSVWITGPMFLVGQTIVINKLLYKIRKTAEKLAHYKKNLIIENNELRKQNLMAKEEIEMRNLEHILVEWGLRYRFIQRSNNKMEEYMNKVSVEKSDSKMQLFSNSSNLPKAKLLESDELGILNYICQSGAVFEEVFINEAQYDLEHLLNKILQKNGIYPYLVFLDKDTAKKSSLLLIEELLSKYNSSELLSMVYSNKKLTEDDKKYITNQINDSDNDIINKTLLLGRTDEKNV